MNVDRSRHRDHVEVCLPGVKAVDGRLCTTRANDGKRLRAVYVEQKLKGEALLALMRFLGAYVAEGNALYNKRNGAWQICIANTDLNFLQELQKDSELFTNASSSITLRERPSAHQLTFSAGIVHRLVTTLCGAHSYEKRVPDVLFTLTDDLKNAFLDSYLRGDGNTQHYKSVESRRLTTNSGRLAAGLGLLLSMLDLDYSIHYQEPHVEGRRFKYQMNIVSSHDNRCDRQCIEAPYEGYVYDLTVDQAHNFCAGVGNIVVHNTHVDRSVLEPDGFLRTNVLGVHVLLEAVRELRIPRLLHISTDEVYGSIPHGAVTEDAPLRPTNPYSAAKAGGDLLALAFWTTHGVPVVITRSSNNFGPYQYPEKVIPLFATNALEDRPLPLYGDGGQIRDWLYVLDNCAAIDVVLRRGRDGEVYNVGAGHEVANLALTREILRLLGKPESLIQPVADRPGHDRRYALDATKVWQLGWAPRYPFASALETTVRWYREHEAWWRPLKSGEFRAYYERQYGRR